MRAHGCSKDSETSSDGATPVRGDSAQQQMSSFASGCLIPPRRQDLPGPSEQRLPGAHNNNDIDTYNNMYYTNNKTNTNNTSNTNTTGVCEKKTPFPRAFATQSFSRNCYPAADLVLRKTIFLYVFVP